MIQARSSVASNTEQWVSPHIPKLAESQVVGAHLDEDTRGILRDIFPNASCGTILGGAAGQEHNDRRDELRTARIARPPLPRRTSQVQPILDRWFA